MKKKYFSIFLLAISMCMVFSAFASASRIYLGNRDAIITLDSAEQSDDTLTLYADYQSYGDNFEIARDICVATDKDFNHVLRLTSCTVESDGRYKYIFRTEEINTPINKIYITPPILYVPTSVPSSSINLSANTQATMSINNQNWFTVTSIETTLLSSNNTKNALPQATDSESSLKIAIVAENSLIPRLPTLTMNNQTIGGTSILSFDEDMNFRSGEFIFTIPSSSNMSVPTNSLNDMTLTVSNALERVEASSANYQANSIVVNVISN